MQTCPPIPSTLAGQVPARQVDTQENDLCECDGTNRLPEGASAAPEKGTGKKLTEIDLELARVYFPVLVEIARSQDGTTIFYSDLVKEAKRRNPGSTVVQRAAIATSAGRRLDALREFTTERGLPDLSALVVNKATGDNGDGFKRSFDGEAIRAQIRAFNWMGVAVSFDQFITEEASALNRRKEAKRKRVKGDEAREMYWAYGQAHRAEVKGLPDSMKEAAIKLIMRGLPVSDAIKAAREASGAARSGARN